MDSSRIAVDLRARTFEIDVPSDQIGAILDRLERLFTMSQMDEIKTENEPVVPPQKAVTEGSGDVEEPTKSDVAR